MSASTLSSAAGDTRLDADPQFTITLVYADLETGRRGKEIHDRLVKQFAQDFNLVLRLWRFDVLQDAKLRALAVQEVAEANMLIISAHRACDMPPTVERWVETILEQKQDSPTALVALFDRNDGDPLEDPDSVYARLHEAARRAKRDFFLNFEQIST